MEDEKKYCVYLITNMLDGKQYAGKTKLTVKGRFNQHKSEARKGNERYICRAIRKHGESNFKVCCIREKLTLKEANREEKFLIKILNLANDSFGYNLTLGGDGVIPNEATVEKMKRNSGMRRWDLPDEEMSRLYKSGMSAIEIGKKFNCGHTAVRRHLRWMGVEIRTVKEWRNVKTPEERSEFCLKRRHLDNHILSRLYSEGWTQQQIANQFNVALTTVFRRIAKTNLPKRPNAAPGFRDKRFEIASERDAYIQSLREAEESGKPAHGLLPSP